MKKPIILGIITGIVGVFLVLGYLLKGSAGNTIVIQTEQGEVLVTNFYKNPVDTTPRGDVLIKRTADYDIVTFADGKTFLITLSRQPLRTARERAENDFLETLGISKEEACKLNVSLKIPFSVDQGLAGRDFHLSFCPNGIAFPEL